MKYFLLIFVALILSCQQESSKPLPDTHHKKEIADALSRVRSSKGYSVDSIAKLIPDYERKAKNLPSEYKAMVEIVRASTSMNRASYQLGIQELEKAISLVKDSKADTLKAFAWSGIGNSHKNLGDFPKAQQYFYKALTIFEKYRDTINISNQYANLGEVFMQKNDLAQAKENLLTALKLLDHDKTSAGYLKAAHSLANVYGMNGEFDKALAIDAEGLRLADSINSPHVKPMFLDNKANCFLYSNRLDSAEYYFKECLELDLKNGNPKQIADTYSNLGALATSRGYFADAKMWIEKSIEILKGINHPFNLAKSYRLLSDMYVKQGDFKKAYEAQEGYQTAYRTMITERKEAALAEFGIVHETEKKEKLLAENRLKLLEKESEVTQRNSLLVLMGVLVLFIGFVGFFISRQQKMRNRQLAQEHELKSAIDRIETQNKLQKQRLEISRDLHDNIGSQLTFIISSVDNLKYAFDLTDSKLDKKLDGISTFARDTIVELRDTIWAMNHSAISFEDLMARVMNFIEKAREADTGIDFKFNVDEALGSIRLSSLVGMNIYRAIQEAVNNAMKYSGASAVSIDISDVGETIAIQIADNGSGFDLLSVEKGNGLQNMEKRMAEVGGLFSIDPNSGNGTRIKLNLPKIAIQTA